MTELKSFGYMGTSSDNISDWADFASKLLGMQVVQRSRTSLALRMDDRKQRLIVDSEVKDGSKFFGWETDGAASLERLAARLEQASVPVMREPQALADQRCVRELISFSDPMGNRIEVFYGAAVADEPFKPGRSISGFRTGPLGLGHAVLTVESIDQAMPFYQNLLGFHLSDYALRPFKAYFFHINSRHHSFAMVETGRNGIHHLMVELFSLDDVGQAYDIALIEEGRVGVTLGRHTNDFMTSFYAKSPSQFMIEYGWGGREIDPATWEPFECTYGPSLWGHERSWLGSEKRAEARELRIRAAAQGMREPVQVLAGNHKLMRGTCPWWDSMTGG